MNLSKRSYQSELLDNTDIPYEDIRRNMEELNLINTYLGGHRITVSGVKALAKKRTSLHVCEIGCGGGDNLAAIVQWANNKKIKIRITGIDINPQCIEVAMKRSDIGQLGHWIVSNYEYVILNDKPDIIFSSLFCHHFTEEQLMGQFSWMKHHSTIGFFINDLHRHRIAYYAIKLLVKCFSKSYLVKHDAPISVTRGFKKNELQTLFERNAIEATISWQWAFRFLVVCRNLDRPK